MKSLFDIFDVTESYKLPDKIMEALLSDQAEKITREVKENSICDLRDLFQKEQGDRERLKQDFTPDCVCTIVAKLMKEGTVLDMCSGTGALSKAAFRERGIKICEQEFSERTVPFALLDACLEGMEGTISRADCLRGTVEETFRLEQIGDISVPNKIPTIQAGTFRNVIMNPPYSMKFPDAEQYPISGFTIPKSKADYGFLLRGLEHLKEDGRLIAVLPHGVLFRGAGEGKIREFLVKGHWINAVIGLPDKLFLNTGIPVCLLICERGSPDILFIDASKTFEKKSAQNDMTPDQVQKVVDSFKKRRNIEKYAYVAHYEEVAENDYNLNIPRYVDTFEPEPLPDMKSILMELASITAEEKTLSQELCKMLDGLIGSPEDMGHVRAHKKILKNACREKATYQQITLGDLYEDAMQTNSHHRFV